MLQLKYAHELLWNDLKYLETPRDALRTIERVHGSKFTTDFIWHAHRHSLPDFNNCVHNGYSTIKNQLENGRVFLINRSTQSPIIQTLELKECGQEVDWTLHNYVNDMMRNALRMAIERVEKPRSVGVLRSSPAQNASQNTNAQQTPVREKHRVLLEIESEDDRPLPAHHNVTLFVENTTKGRRAANQKHDVIDNQLSREFSAEKGDALKTYVIPSTQGAVLEDLKANSNVQQSESEGLISALTETGQEVEANGTILHHFTYKVPGKTTFKMMRIKQTPHTTISELTVEHDPNKKWYVLEAGGPDSQVSGRGRIKQGTYQLTPYSSSNYPNEFQLNQVPGRTNIIMYEYDTSKKLTTGLALGTSYDFSDDAKQYYKVDGSADAKQEIYDMIGDGEAEIVISSAIEKKEIDIDYDFISSLEGVLKTDGYVPDVENSQSGVTISTGFDLGARNRLDLVSLGLDDDLIDKLQPYLGLKEEDAVDYLSFKPLTISTSEAKDIYEKVKKQSTDTLVNRYNSDSSVEFVEIPSRWQTVIASIEYQYGCAKSETPKFWKQVTAQDWESALKNLENFGDSYPTRRRKEASFVKNKQK